MMEGRFNPLDPLGIFGVVKRDVDRMAGGLRLPGPPRLTKPGATIGNPIPVEFNGDLVLKKDAARRQLLARGYPETLVDLALNWQEEWLMGIARDVASDRNLQREVVQSAYQTAKVVTRTEAWITGIQRTFGIPVPVGAG